MMSNLKRAVSVSLLNGAAVLVLLAVLAGRWDAGAPVYVKAICAAVIVGMLAGVAAEWRCHAWASNINVSTWGIVFLTAVAVNFWRLRQNPTPSLWFYVFCAAMPISTFLNQSYRRSVRIESVANNGGNEGNKEA